MTAEATNTARQDPSEAMKLETGRAPMTPIMSPLATAPMTRPRVASGERCADRGIRICTATEPRPIAPAQARKAIGDFAKAAAVSETAQSATQASTSRRFSTRSASGTTKKSPTP